MPKTVIDNLTSTTGWSGTNCTISVDSWKDFTTSFLESQLKFVFSDAGIATKTFTPIALKTDFQFSIVADTDEKINSPIDYRMKVKLYDGLTSVEYYLPVDKQFRTLQFDKGNLVNIDKIEFIALEKISVMISEIITYEDQFPLDVYQGIKELLEKTIQESGLLQIGTATATTGSKSINITNQKYLDKYSVIQIGAEKHCIKSIDGNFVTFLKTFDGEVMKQSYNNEPVYLNIPVQFEGRQEEDSIPAIQMSGSFQATEKEEIEPYSPETDSHRTDGFIRTYTIGNTWIHSITIEAESRHEKILEILLRILKIACNSTTMYYVNARRTELNCKEIKFIDYADATDIISKISVECETWITERKQNKEIQKYGNLDLITQITRLN